MESVHIFLAIAKQYPPFITQDINSSCSGNTDIGPDCRKRVLGMKNHFSYQRYREFT